MHGHRFELFSSKLPEVLQLRQWALPVQVRHPGIASMQFEHCSCWLMYDPVEQPVQLVELAQAVQLAMILPQVTQLLGSSV